MKLYISIPITGRPIISAKHHANTIKARLAEYGHECITPFDICTEPDRPYAHYMGKDIEALLADNIEGVVFGCGFYNSKGCMLERAAAGIYGKHIVYESCFDMLDFDTLTVKPI